MYFLWQILSYLQQTAVLYITGDKWAICSTSATKNLLENRKPAMGSIVSISKILRRWHWPSFSVHSSPTPAPWSPRCVAMPLWQRKHWWKPGECDAPTHLLPDMRTPEQHISPIANTYLYMHIKPHMLPFIWTLEHHFHKSKMDFFIKYQALLPKWPLNDII